MSIKAVVLDKPDAVRDLSVSDITERSAVLKWSPPSADGGSAIQ